MTKRTKRPQADSALVEPKSFDELVTRASELVNDSKCSWNTCEFRAASGIRTGTLLALTGTVGLTASIGTWTTLSAALTGLLMGGTAFAYGIFTIARGRRLHRQAHLNSPPNRQPLAKHITAYLGKLIAEEQRRCIGENSEIERLRKRAEEVHDRARTLLARLEARVSEERYRGSSANPVPAYLIAAHARAERLAERLARSRDRLSEHRAKLDAFFQECTARVWAAEKPLQDLELVEAVEVLDAEGERLGTEVQEVIIRSTGELFGRLQQLRSTLGVSLAHAGVHLALTAPMTGNLERDANVLEDTIRRFRPPRIVESEATDETRAT